MEKNKQNRSINFIGNKETRLNVKIISFLFFLLLAFILWLLNALDNNYSANITFPIKYINHQPNKEMVGNIPAELNLNVNGHGYAILKNMLTAKSQPIIIRLMSLNFIETADSSKTYVLTRNLKELVQRQLGTEMTLNYIQPDTFFYNFSPIINKKVPVTVVAKIEFEQQYMRGGDFIIQPESVFISGPKAIIDTTFDAKTTYKTFSNVNKSFTAELALEPVDKLHINRNSINVTIPVDKFTESSITVPVKCINLPDSIELKVFPSSINVKFIVSLRNYSMVNPRLFRAVVDYKTIGAVMSNKLKIVLEKQPSFVHAVQYYPKSVDYIIEK